MSSRSFPLPSPPHNPNSVVAAATKKERSQRWPLPEILVKGKKGGQLQKEKWEGGGWVQLLSSGLLW